MEGWGVLHPMSLVDLHRDAYPRLDFGMTAGLSLSVRFARVWVLIA